MSVKTSPVFLELEEKIAKGNDKTFCGQQLKLQEPKMERDQIQVCRHESGASAQVGQTGLKEEFHLAYKCEVDPSTPEALDFEKPAEKPESVKSVESVESVESLESAESAVCDSGEPRSPSSPLQSTALLEHRTVPWDQHKEVFYDTAEGPSKSSIWEWIRNIFNY
ncbi:unnamed protein product [Knipowitschia caucasica]|uniref:Uncharacterized protein n=1 Tax=Knipowitschia caucasica TaxID=637954 RepID=A0AAV2J0N5_KNICA